tara:strand:+ start:6419 stop:6580 length:162 start_codon:yes stop_codon:yes gene_type:complete
MRFDYEWKWGLVFGLEYDQLYLLEEEEEEPDWDSEPASVIYLHLGVISVALIH